MPASTPAVIQPRNFEDLTREEAFNLGRVVGLFAQDCRVQRLEGKVVITTRYGRPMPMEELLRHAKLLRNPL